MARTALDTDLAVAFGGPLFERLVEGDVLIVCNWLVGIVVGAASYVHPHVFAHRADAEAFAAKVNARRTVDLTFWILDETPSLEERLGEFGIEWQLEQEDRRAWGA